MQTSMSDVSSEMADVTEVPLASLEKVPDTVLAASLRRILRDAQDPNPPLAAFDSALAD